MAGRPLATEQAFFHSLPRLASAELVPELRRVLATAQALPHYAGSPVLAGLTEAAAKELSRRGAIAEALPLYREAVAGYASTLGADHEAYVIAAANFGTSLLNIGELAEAAPLLEQSLVSFTRLHGSESDSALRLLDQVASVRLMQGDRVGAAALLTDGLTTLGVAAARAGLAWMGLDHYPRAP